MAVLLVWADASHSRLNWLVPAGAGTHLPKISRLSLVELATSALPLGYAIGTTKLYAHATLTAVFGWLREHSGAMAFSLNKVPAEGEFAHHLRLFAQQQGGLLNEHDTWERALLKAGISGEDYVTTHQRKKKLKEYSRLRRRLEDVGELEFQTLLPGQSHDLSQWIHDFLRLEAGGLERPCLDSHELPTRENGFSLKT